MIHLKIDRLYGQLSGWDFSNDGNTPFFFFPGGHDTSRGIEPGKTSAQQGN